MEKKTTLKRQAALFAVVAIVLASMLVSLWPRAAWAEDGVESNLVDPTQRADNSFIYDTTVAALFSQASLYDDRTVQIVGEVIGDRVHASEPNHYWITLTEVQKDDASNISLLMSEDQTSQISNLGRYGVVGTTLQVRGTYHQACVEHDGLPDVHVTDSSVLDKGRVIEEPLNATALLPGILAIIVGGGLLALFYYFREGQR